MIPAALLLAATAAAGPSSLPPRPPDGTYAYTLFYAGGSLGTSTVVVSTPVPGTVVVKESARYQLPALTATTTAQYDAATLTLKVYAGDFTTAKGPLHMIVGVKPGALTVEAPPAAPVDIPADPSAPVELVGDNLIGVAMMVPAVLHAAGARAFTLAVVPAGPALVVKVAADAPASRPATVPAGDASLTVDAATVRFVYWYDPATYVVHDIAIPAQGADFRLTSTNAGAAAPATPAPLMTALPTPQPHFTSRDVRFNSLDGTVLAGTLTVPDRGRGPFPAVVFVHGSGGQDRDETVGPNPFFLQLSNALSNAGYAVLRYDKRGIGKSGGSAVAGTRGKLIDDVTAALQFVRAQSDVDPKQVYLLGHSEGGELVPTVATQHADVAGIILMAPPSLPIWRVSTQQVLAGVPRDKLAAAERAQREALDAIRRGTDANMAWYRSTMDVDPVVDIARVKAPILILQGERDIQVSARDLPRLVKAARAKNSDVTVRTFSNDNHLFEAVTPGVVQTPASALHQYLTVPAYIDVRVLTTLTTWLARHTAAPR